MKTIYIALLLQLSLFGETFEWKGSKQSQTVNEPLQELSKMIEKDMSAFIYDKKTIDISQAIPPKIDQPILPTEIEKPHLPEALKLARGEYETTKAFDKRVLAESKKRDLLLKSLQEDYRISVQKRNKRIEALSVVYNEKVKSRNSILKRLQAIQEKDVKRYEAYYKSREPLAKNKIAFFAKDAVDTLYGEAKVRYKGYNPDSENMYLLITSNDGENFTKDVSIKMPPYQAKAFREDLSNVDVSVVFDVEMLESSQIAFSIKEITLSQKEISYLAIDTNSEYIFEPMYVTIDNQAVKFDATSASLDTQNIDTQFALQNPNLNDKSFTFGAVAMTADGAIIGVNQLVNEIKAMPSRKSDSKKWLFMIAVETYDETDNVIYASRSAVAMRDVLQKRLGISRKNTVTLFDEKATSGAIKDNFKRMLSKVKKEDTIYFYYSGHGIPSKSGDAFILPRDKVVDFIADDEFFKLENIYALMSDSNAKHSFAFIDACFSGTTDNKLLFKGVAAGLIRTKKTLYDEERMTIITAGADDEFSNMYKEEKYRLFSYYLTKALMSNVKDIDILYKKVNVQVLEKSKEFGSRYEQNTQIYGNRNIRL